jgi:hypothetical protein
MFDIPAAVEAGSNLISKILDKVAPDADFAEKNRITLALTEMQNEYNVVLAQLKINDTEAASPSFFVAGARPAAMWVGVISLAYSGIGISLLSWISLLFGGAPLPFIDTSTQMNLLMGLLGLGGMRTYEKTKGVDTKTMGK